MTETKKSNNEFVYLLLAAGVGFAAGYFLFKPNEPVVVAQSLHAQSCGCSDPTCENY